MSTLRLPPSLAAKLGAPSARPGLLGSRAGQKRVIVLGPSEPRPARPPKARPAKAAPKAPVVPASKRQRQALATMEILHTRWPRAFPRPGTRVALHPVAIGIHDEIAAAAPDLTARRVDLALRGWTGRLSYLEALAKGRRRVHLDGRPGAAVSPAERQDAEARLREKRAKKPA